MFFFVVCYIIKQTPKQLLNWNDEKRNMSSGHFESKCTFRMCELYETLQWSVCNTLHTENRVISELFKCPAGLRMDEYKRFGCMRAGHHLQLLNLAEVLESRGLSLQHNSVALLVGQLMWQIGPLDGLGNLYDATDDTQLRYSASQELFAKVDYLNILGDKLLELTETIAKKWSDHVMLYVLIMIAQRSIALMPNNDSRTTQVR